MARLSEYAPRIFQALDIGVGGLGLVREALAGIDHFELPLAHRDQGRWILVIPKKLESPNKTVWGHWRALSRERKAWDGLLRVAIANAHGRLSTTGLRESGAWSAPTERMRLTVFRFVASRRQFIRDDDNLAFALKHANDALKSVGLVRDDDRAWLAQSLPQQDLSPIAGHPVTVFVLQPDPSTRSNS